MSNLGSVTRNSVMTNTSIVPNEFSEFARSSFDKASGCFEGMVTKVLNCVEPVTIRIEQSFVDNKRWSGTCMFLLLCIMGGLWVMNGSWSFLFWTVGPTIPSAYVGHRITKFNNSARATSSEVMIQSRAGNLPETVPDTLSKECLEEITTKIMEVVGDLLKTILDLVGLADQLAEGSSTRLVDNIYRDGKRDCNEETKKDQVALAREDLKVELFVKLLHRQLVDTTIIDKMYKSLNTQTKAQFSRICNSQSVDYRKVAKHFLSYVEGSKRYPELLKAPETQALILSLLTNGWRGPGRQGSVVQNEVQKLILESSMVVRKTLIQELKAPCVDRDSANSSQSVSPADASVNRSLRQRQGKQ